eukprot:Blabericola_migrator_1__6489@NODE_3276_length_1890_cov_54_854635_g1983_i1_p1_GENE_NODE_3276_length_1890_cov_54_854635_g1983_i1NODE_3276_length_1890_cov_54_854635_g1983_i1_p1_ORF_typecomplete_len128_score13_87_NODE_3276_length_1890_cov_54_854635_g1983_i135418
MSCDNSTLEDVLAAWESPTTKVASTAPQHVASSSMDSPDLSLAPIQETPPLSLEHCDVDKIAPDLSAWLEGLDEFPEEESTALGILERDAPKVSSYRRTAWLCHLGPPRSEGVGVAHVGGAIHIIRA